MSTAEKWRKSFQKTRSQSQSSLDLKNRRTSLLEESEPSEDELEKYLGTLKEKSGVGRLWKGNTFDKIIDRTPDVSISSVSEGEAPNTEEESSHNDDDFRPNLLDLSKSTNDENKSAISEPSSIEPLQAVNMFSELSEGELVNNVKFNISDKEIDNLFMAMDVKSITNDLSNVDEAQTLDEVTEEIEEDLKSMNSEHTISSLSNKKSKKSLAQSPPVKHRHHSSSHHSSEKSNKTSHRSSRHSSQAHSESVSNQTSRRRPSSRKSSRKEISTKKSDYSYSTDFSEANNQKATSDSHDFSSYSSSKSSTLSNSSRISVKPRSIKHRDNISHHDVATQVNTCTQDMSKGQRLPAVGMATLGPSIGNDYVFPSPIVPHVISADAVEALTAYNPAIVALTDMLRQQLKLVEQFVDNSRRMYESYTSNLNTTYKYTTLEDTIEYLQQNEPRHFHRKNRENHDENI